jgi:hypothetical protein
MGEHKLLDAALELEELVYPVLLLRSGEKVPALTGGHRKATTDPTTIAEWWKAIPQANVGISASDLIVLDLDAPDGLSWPDDEPLNQELQEQAGAVARSPRGGRHIYFASPELVEVLCSAD